MARKRGGSFQASAVDMPTLDECRNQILTALQVLHDGKNPVCCNGVGHAVAVEESALDVLESYQYQGIGVDDALVLRAASLLHDAGMCQATDNWSLDLFEHVSVGLRLAAEILSENPVFRDRPRLMGRVLELIEQHDSTVYSYPSLTCDGRPFLPTCVQGNQSEQVTLDALREADSLLHASDDCVAEAMDDWLARGLPIVSKDHVHWETWRWMDSVVGNLRLLGKRALVDTRTKHGQAAALAAYQDLERRVETCCIDAEVSYQREICNPATRQESLDSFNGMPHDLQIMAFYGWKELEATLRSVVLRGDNALKPYETADLSLRTVDLEAVSPMALYVMKSRLDENRELYDAMMAKYSLGLWDLPGLLQFKYCSDGIQSIAPPVVESYVETAYPGEPTRVLGILDGLHRCTLARDSGMQSVKVVCVSDVPYPPLPISVDWDAIRQYDKTPPTDKRRVFRYPTLRHFPRFSYAVQRPRTDEEARYYFYRELDSIGSTGQRFG